MSHQSSKRGAKISAANYRPVSITSICCKVLEHIVVKSILSHLERHNILVDFQHGFRASHSTESQLITTVDDLATSLNLKRQTDVVILDFSKAFDTVPHQRLLAKLKYYGVNSLVVRWISNWLSNRSQRVLVDGESSSDIAVTSGVPQGSVLGPLLFLIYINDIGDTITQGTKIRLFADDCVLYREIISPRDSEILQHDLSTLHGWSSKWQMRFNAAKCYTINVTNKLSAPKYTYSMNDQLLSTVKSQPYLGVELEEHLSWKTHVEQVCAKANRSLGFLRRNLSRCSRDVKIQAYLALVRPQLEYAAAAWDPGYKYLTDMLEMVQRRAVRFVTSTYDRTTSITALRKDLGWPSLEERRKVKRLTLFQKAVHCKVAIKIPARPSTRQSRRDNNNRYIPPATSIDAYRSSFFPRTISDWNSLPGYISGIEDEDEFKIAVLEYLHD